ncbi:hypothetical protein EYF80_024184 [Liparis tanakae]|uniref:Uncharacterized protein n=1 Tax=Liparis tanakae TaxID=230148 RepID=A0A4Z2HK49_9TELE|nr:hypothetical protein EYF80_024184 [Liparis tanakae]
MSQEVPSEERHRRSEELASRTRVKALTKANMLLYSLVHAVEIFQYTGLIFQLLVETSSYFQPPVVFCSYQAPNNLKSAILEAGPDG